MLLSLVNVMESSLRKASLFFTVLVRNEEQAEECSVGRGETRMAAPSWRLQGFSGPCTSGKREAARMEGIVLTAQKESHFL